MNKHILEKLQIVAGIIPVALDGGANAGDYVSLKNYGRCAIVVFKAAGTAGDDPVIAVKQAQDVAGTGVKDILFSRVDSKEGTQTGIGTFTRTDQTAAASYSNLTLAEKQAVIVIDIAADELDVDNGFDCLQVSIADVGTNAQIGSAFYILHEPRYVSGTLPSAIVD